MGKTDDFPSSGGLASTLARGAEKARPRVRRYPGEGNKEFRDRLAREDILARERERDPSLDPHTGRRRPVRYEE